MVTIQQTLHDLITVVAGADLVLSASDGQISPPGSPGWYSRDRRTLARLEIEVVGHGQVTVGRHRAGPSELTVHSVISGIVADTTDPTITASRQRTVSASALTEAIRLVNFGATTVKLTIRAHTETDLAGIDAVRSGRPAPPVVPLLHGGSVRWEGEGITVSLRCAPAPDAVAVRAARAELEWVAELPPGAAWSLELAASCAHGRAAEFAPVTAAERLQWTVQPLPAPLDALVAANLADLDALLLADPDQPGDRYAAAGVPWYLTLFGRDTLWTARMLLPLAPELAAGTLRVLARRQGARHDGSAEEAPGKILHEARPAPTVYGDLRLPARYYGSIDATALWVALLHDAWQGGMPAAQVTALLPNLVTAMEWITGRDADPDGDGLLEYAASAHGGLANQGWKDSPDAIRHLDGRRAAAPVALCEVQGYAYAAAVGASAIADAFGLVPGADWLSWAHRLRDRFRSTFWLRDDAGPYPAIALDAGKNPVSGAASNMAHLLGTGILDATEAAHVAARLAAELTTDFGLRTLTTKSAAFNPVSYHCGSIWPHDTAIAITGLAAEGHRELADRLARGLIRAAGHFDGRPPELYGVLPEGGPPVHYPSACRPQAWAAAAITVAARTVARAEPGSASGHR